MTAPPAGAVWVDGRIVDATQPVIHADDHGVLVGDGVFETLLVRQARPLFWRRHTARLVRSLAAAGIAAPAESTLREATRAVLAASRLLEGRLRLTVTSGRGGEGLGRGPMPTLVVSLAPLRPSSGPAPAARVITAPGARNERSPLVGVKTTSYAEAAALAERAAANGADDVILGDSRDRVSEALTANVFVVLAGRLVTPSPATGCLPGIIRELVLEAGIADEVDLSLTELEAAEEVFLSSSVTGVRPVRSIDGRAIPVVDGTGAERARRAIVAAEAADLEQADPLG